MHEQIIIDKLDLINRELAINTTETRNIRERMDKLNGSISNHESRLNGIERNQDLMTANIAALQKKNTGLNDVWRRWSDRIVWFGLVLLAYLFYHLLIITNTIKDIFH